MTNPAVWGPSADSSRLDVSASEMTYIVSSGALNSTHSLTPAALKSVAEVGPRPTDEKRNLRVSAERSLLRRALVSRQQSLYGINVKKLNSLKQCLTTTRPTSHN